MGRVRIKVNGRKGERKIRDKWIVDLQKKYPHRVQRNRKRYKRRHKFKGKNYED